jgi:NAD(P)H-flavin reductase/CheY-like chemotaxis protein/formate hydrogenlyase subunit 6/NADH:ubiquinone oxidoreductase subunit I
LFSKKNYWKGMRDMNGSSVLVIESDPIVRASLCDWLSSSGFEVTSAESGEETLKVVGRRNFNIVVMDVRQQGEKQLATLREMKAISPWIKSIIITAYPQEETVLEAKKIGIVDYMIKPVDMDDLQRIINGTIESIYRDNINSTEMVSYSESYADDMVLEVKKSFAISRENLALMVENLIKELEVVGVKAKHGKYVYDRVSSFFELSLDYDVTVSPPTRYLFPERETLLKFRTGNGQRVESVINYTPRVIIGVHPYDIKAIELLDEVFISHNPDPNYIARRENTIIIGVDCLHPSPKSFAPSMGTNWTETGFDLLLTDIGNSYIVKIGSEKGAEILARHTKYRIPTGDEIVRQKKVRGEALGRYKLSLDVPKDRMPKILEESYDDPYWEARSAACLSCGSCVMVCPTCYCFDVRDEMALNLKDGERFRRWDGCMLVDFAKVASGENFRRDKASRFRHRMFRKGKYILERYGRVGCVGCGRCASACLAGIASPLEAFNAIAENVRLKEAATSLVQPARQEKELYAPETAEIVSVRTLTEKEKVFELKLKSGKKLGHSPGQFVTLSIMGVGEAPLSISSSPLRGKTFQLAVRNMGDLTSALHSLQAGATVGIRGPFGHGFPLEALEGKDLLLIAGGIGLFPLRSLIQYVMDRRYDYGKVSLLYGCRAPAERVFTDELEYWQNSKEIDFHETVDKKDDTWTGNVGVITNLIDKIEIDPKKTMVAVVGPPVMYKFVIEKLKKRDLPDDHVYLSLERKMKCGVGKCGHCQINGVYTCQEGPVFSLTQLRSLREAVL